MAFLRKAGGILGRIASTNIINSEISLSKPSFLQAIRCMSTSKLFIGGLSYSTDDTSLREAFDKYGEVAEARVIVDRETGRSRGFGFVTFSSTEEASAAIQALDQQDLHGRMVRVNFANERARGGGGYGGGGGYSGGGGGYSGGGGGYSGGGGGYSGGGGGYSGGGGYGGGGGGYGNEAATDSYPAAGGESGGGGSFGYGGEGQNSGVDDNDSYADRRG
ncbi:hypothetical protein ABFX02_04G145200 [Erythranthe guttata]